MSERIEILSPYDGQVVGSVEGCDAVDVDRACAAAAAALAGEGFHLDERVAALERAALLLRERSGDLAATITAESGKPRGAARAEVERCVETLGFSAAEARTLHGETIPYEASPHGRGRLGFTLPVPIGIVAAVTPFNYPLNLVAHKVAPALAAGCPVVLKPAPQTPLTALAFVALLRDAGVPEEWVTVVPDSGAAAGRPLVAHEAPAMVSFTGSAAVGRQIERAAEGKRVALELGSNAPVIVEPDADPAAVAGALRRAGFVYAGQNCISVQRVIVHSSRHAELVEALVAEVDRILVGDPAEEATEIGPLISPEAADRVKEWLDEAVAAGGALLTGGERRGRAIVTPAVVDQVPAGSRLWREEVFGPVLGVVTYDDFGDALALANETDLPLQAGIYTGSLGRAMEAVRALRFGGVHVNQMPTFRVDLAPYGGTGGAGNTREGPRSAIREMTEWRVVSLPAPGS